MGELASPRTACSRAGGGCRRGNFFEIFYAKSRVWGQFGTENKLIEGQPKEYDVICRNASVLAFHLWSTIFAGAAFRLKNICRNGVPPRSRTTTPLFTPRELNTAVREQSRVLNQATYFTAVSV